MDTGINGLLGRSKRSIYHTARIKKYPSGECEIMVASRPVFRESGWEDRSVDKPLAALAAATAAANEAESEALAELSADGQDSGNVRRAARRAAAKVRDIALCNDFRWFVTLTLDRQRIDRYDIRTITKKLNQWLDNAVRRYGLRYVLVPERHQDGAIHFHGLISDAPGIVSSGTWNVPGHKKPVRPRSQRQAASWAERGAEEGFQEVFNWGKWPYGFSTAIRLYGEYDRAVGYVCKYIRKQTLSADGKIGGRWYYSGGALVRPTVEFADLGIDELLASNSDAYCFTIPDAHLAFAVLRRKNVVEKNDFTISGE